MYIKYLIIIFALFAQFEFVAQIKYTSKKTGLGIVTDITHAGDGSQRIFVANKAGTIIILDAGYNTLGTLLNISALVTTTDNEKGLLGLAFHPDFETNGHFFVNYNPTGTNHTVIARFTAPDPSANSTVNNNTQKTILTITTAAGTNHKAGDLAFGSDGFLYITTGDGGGGGDPQGSGQNGNTFLGKILRLDINTTSPYLVPATNPFLSNTDGIYNEIWDLGLRNPWRISFDKQTNDLWIADVGQGAREEVNFEAAGAGGKNYGWNCREGKIAYNGCTTPAGNFTNPILDYSRCGSPCVAGTGNSITGGFVYRGTASSNTSMIGYYIFADYVSKHAWMIKQTSGSLTDTKTITSLTTAGITSFGELENGEIMAGLSNGGLGLIESTECTQAPTISLSSTSTSYPRGSSFTVNTSVNDPDGNPVSVEFYNNNVLLETDNSAPFNLTISPANAASYSITGKVFDNCGLMTLSSALSITTFSCDDGVQNGDETGIDCGGSCISCSQPCPAPVNLSQGKTATQSSLYNSSYPASKAVDGSTSNTNFNCTLSELQPWWQVNLEANQQVNNIEITNRTGCPGCNGRIKRFKVFVTSTPVADFSISGAVFEYNNPTGLVDGQVINISNLSSSGQYVRIWVDNTGYGANYLHLAEVKVLNCNNTSDPCANNLPPTISLSSVSSSYPKGSSFTVNTTVNDPDGTLQKVEFYNNNILLETDNTAPFNLIVSPADAASYSITGKVFDNCNLSILSSPLSITTFSCTDGIQNGNETGVDCGGSCISCSQNCPSPVNLSQGKTATQSSLFNAAYPASKAVDGNTSNTSFNCTLSELQPWWQVNLGDNQLVTDIEITNRTGCPGCNGRLKRFKVFVTTSPVAGYSASGAVFEYNNPTGLIDGQVINISNLNSSGQYVRIWVDNTGYGANYLHLAEVKVLYCNNTSDPCPNNLPPTISLSSASSSFPKGSSFTVNATVNDPDGTPEKVEFYNNNVLLETDNSAPFNLVVSPADAASYSITGKVFDTCNLSTLSSPMSITTFSCTDGIQNGNETGVDCGGSCNACSQLCPSPINLSQGKTATQSSLYNAAYPASKAVDGSTTNTSFNCTLSELQPWWQVNLGASYSVTNIEITNRTGCPGCNGRLKRFKVFVTSSPVAGYSTGGAVYEYNNPTGLVDGQVINITNLISSGQYIRIWMDNTGYGANYLHLAEIKVMGCASSAAIVGPVPQINPSFSSKESGVKLFPNPTRDMIHFQFENAAPSSVQVQVYDLQGRILHSETTLDQKVNISKLAAGTYLLRIHHDQKISMHKVVKS